MFKVYSLCITGPDLREPIVAVYATEDDVAERLVNDAVDLVGSAVVWDAASVTDALTGAGYTVRIDTHDIDADDIHKS